MKGRYLFGLLILLIGLAMFVERLGFGDMVDMVVEEILVWWPVGLIIIGVHELYDNPRRLWGPLIWFALGVLLLAHNVFDTDLWSFVVPTVLIVLGLSMLMKKRGDKPSPNSFSYTAGSSSSKNYRQLNESIIAVETTLGESKYDVCSADFRSGRVTVLLGSMVIDLRNAGVSQKSATLMAECTLGSLEIIAPSSVRINVVGSPVLGSLDIASIGSENVDPDAPLLTIDVSGALSEVAIRRSH